MKIYSLLLCFFIFSCKNDKSINYSDGEKIPFTTIDSTNFKLSSILKTSTFIPLESSEISLLSGVDNLIMSDKNILVLDKRGVKGVMLFDIGGKFIRKIGKIGKRPGEYVMIDDFTFDPQNSIIYCLVNQTRVIAYDLSGKFLTNFRLNFIAAGIEYLPKFKKLYFVAVEEQKNNLVVTDLEGKVSSSYIPNSERGEHTRILVHAFLNVDTAILYRRYLDNNIYSVRGDDATVKYSIDFGDKALSQSTIESYLKVTKDSLEHLLANYKQDLNYFTENSKYIVSLYFDNHKPQLGLYNKVAKSAFSGSYTMFKDDILGLNSVPILEYLYKDKFISIIQPRELINSENIGSKRLVKTNQITEMSNPILWVLENNN